MKNVIVICGPTASGKTQISLLLSKLIDAEIINADSRQVYKYMDIGTAKPSIEERNIVPHHFVDIINPDEHYDAGLFGEQARIKISDIFQRNKIPVVVGGSGLYIRSLIDGLFEGPKRDENIRRDLEQRLKEKGADDLLDEIKRIDPETASKLTITTTHRIIRALEVFYLTKEPLTKLQKENKIQIDFIPSFYGIKWDREILYSRVNERARDMIYQGLIEECTELLSRGYNSNLKSMQTVGYKECFDYIEEKINYEEMIDLIQKNTRHYVKRQFTWFNHDDRIQWINLKSERDFQEKAAEIVNDFKKRQSTLPL
jgi:tRNA dimethylallyltransferase